MKKLLTKLIAIILVAITLLNMCATAVKAAVELTLDKAYIQTIGYADNHLKYYRESLGYYTYYTTIVAGYESDDGTIYPVYCMDRLLPGADEDPYYVTTENLLDNDEVWRVIRNGYPFTTASEWGLSEDYNLYAVTRFAIYCILGQTELDYFMAEDDDSEAQAMLKALKKLVSIGENGTETPDTDPLSATKTGDFEESGDYYIQEYEVISTSDFSKYTISSTKGLPDGAYIANEDGEKQTTFSKGESFYIKIPKTALSEDIDVTVNISAECKVYLVYEGKTTVSGTQDYAVTAGESATATTSINFKEETNTGKVKIAKIDTDTEEPIEGIEFQLLDTEGNVIDTQTTNSNGIAQFTGLYQGEYVLKETDATDKYIPLDETFDVSVEYNKTTEIGIENEKKKGNLQVYKIDKDNNKLILGSVKFDLYSNEDEEVIGTYSTDENGQIYIEGLPIGTYTLIEKTTNQWYNLADDVEVEINWNETTEVTIENELKKGQAKVIKVDSENEEIKIEGVKFNVLDEDGNVLETIVTDENGEAVTSEYVIRDYDTIYLQEIETNEKYVLNDELIKVELTANEVQSITVENEKIKGQIQIIKTSADDNNVTGEKAGTPLEGVEFEIYDSEGNLLETVTTDEEGIALTSLLEKGEYKVKEISTNEWYYLNEETYTANIEENNQIVSLNITNESKNPDVEIEKVGQDEAEIGSEIEYDISIRNTGNTSLDNLTWTDEIAYEYIEVTKFSTGTYNQDVNYNLYYKTNLSDDEYILLMEDLNSQENYEIDFEFELPDGEYVTGIKLEFDTVDVGFCSNENPHLTARVKDTVKSETTITNTVNIIAEYNGYTILGSSAWDTFVYKLLPKTGF